MVDVLGNPDGSVPAQAAEVETVGDLAQLLRELRRREARERGSSELTYRELAVKTGWSHGIIGEYLSGRVLPPTDRFDALIRLLGAGPGEQGALATARDRVAERRRHAAAGSPSPPRELPADVSRFTGRAAYLAELDSTLAAGSAAATVVISAVSGTAGVGKTALAVRWAHHVADRFPDGQLYVDLRGYDAGRPVAPDAALARFLRSLGVPATEVPADLAERAARYRTLLAGRRMLVVLDNARSAEQVRPLLPGTSSCSVLVTSRDDLAGLVAREGACRIDLDVLSAAEAYALLRALIGARVAAEPEAAALLAERCARLPLALRVAAELAAARPRATLAELAADLGDEQFRLRLLDAGSDPRAAVRVVFSWSHRHLPPPTARAFALLGIHPGREVDEYDVAALAEVGPDRARRFIDELCRAHLTHSVRPGRYGMHDLLRAYAAERAADLGAGPRAAALTRLFDHYLRTTAAAVETLYPKEHDNLPPVGPPASPDPAVSEAGPALVWLDGVRPNLVAAAAHAAEHGWPSHSVRLSQWLWRYLDDQAHYQDALAIHTSAVRAAGTDGRAAASVLTNLSVVHWRLGRTHDALDDLQRALAGYRRAADEDGQARVMANLGVVHTRLGRYREAGAHHQEALVFYRRLGDQRREGWQLINIGLLHERQGRYAEAADHHRRGAEIFRAVEDRRLEGEALINLAIACERLGRYPEALGHLDQALVIAAETGNRRLGAETLNALGSVHRELGRYPEALDHLGRALSTNREIGDRGLEAETRNGFGETLRAMSRPEPARAHHEAALDLAREIGNRQEQARALDGLADALDRTGHRDWALDLWRDALTIYTDLGVPQAARLRDRLAGAGGRSIQ